MINSKFGYILFLILMPLWCSAQSDLNTRYFRIDATSLPEVEELPSFTLKKAPFVFDGKMPSSKITEENYWSPVSMEDAINQKEFSATTNGKIKDFKTPQFLERRDYKNFSITSQYTSDGKTRVNNEVYKPYGGLEYFSRYNNYNNDHLNPYRNRMTLEIRMNGDR